MHHMILVLYRVYLDYHTPSQVLWGALIGIITGCCWFTIVQVCYIAMFVTMATIMTILQLLLTPFFPEIVCNPIGEFFMLRDCTLIPNILWFEYTSLKSEAKLVLNVVLTVTFHSLIGQDYAK